MSRKNVLIMGAAGRDFHNFNVYFRDKEEYNVVAFTATQIPILMEESIRLNWLEAFIQKELKFMMNLN